jgi:hypothetical protein
MENAGWRIAARSVQHSQHEVQHSQYEARLIAATCAPEPMTLNPAHETRIPKDKT